MRLRVAIPISHCDLRPFEEIVIISQDGAIRIFLHAIIGDDTFTGIITEVLVNSDLLQINQLEADVVIRGEIVDGSVFIERRSDYEEA